jgi:hypothetical protein
MSGDVSIKVEGLDRLTASLGALKSDLADIAPADAARIIGTAAQSRAPKRTGRMASSFSFTAENGTVSLRFGTAYAGPINFGVGPRVGLRGPHNIPATRFLTGAVSDREAQWIESYKDAAQDAADKVKGA